MAGKKVKVFLISVEEKLLIKLEKEAAKNFLSRNAFVNCLIRERLKK
jgi:metal-responsive CopG/Arc/MetJ family transcriptional regulator